MKYPLTCASAVQQLIWLTQLSEDTMYPSLEHPICFILLKLLIIHGNIEPLIYKLTRQEIALYGEKHTAFRRINALGAEAENEPLPLSNFDEIGKVDSSIPKF